ncbi:MAG: hypothetical protein WD674_11105 [Cucumibacter sp.]
MSLSTHTGPASPPSRFAQGLLDLLERVEYRPATYSEDVEEIYRLRYEAYRREGYIPENPDRRCIDGLDEAPNVYKIGVYLDGRLVSSIRVHHVTGQHRHSAGMWAYPDVIGPMLDDGMSFVDPSRFTTDYEVSLEYPALSYLTLRLGVMASDYFRADYCLQIVRPEHGPFYRRIFQSKPLAEVRAYAGLSFPVQLYGSHVPTTLDGIYRRHPFFMSTPGEQRMMFRRDERGVAPLTVLPTARFAHRARLAEPALA